MRIYAHRGLHSPYVVKNSRQALTAAQEAGFGFETDLRTTRDGVHILHHDRTLPNQTQTVDEVDYADLVDALGHEVATLDWLMDQAWWCPVNLEIKNRSTWESSKKAIAVWAARQSDVLISSFDHDIVVDAEVLGFNAARLLASAHSGGEHLPTATTLLGTVVLDMNIASRDLVRRYENDGYDAIVYGPHTHQEHAALVSWGVTAVITDYPHRAERAKREA